jgi:hypothetical protein
MWSPLWASPAVFLPRSPTRSKWQRANIATDELEPLFEGADRIAHLAWAIQPSRNLDETEHISTSTSKAADGYFDAGARAWNQQDCLRVVGRCVLALRQIMFKREAASEIRRLFFRPFAPSWLLNRNQLH